MAYFGTMTRNQKRCLRVAAFADHVARTHAERAMLHKRKRLASASLRRARAYRLAADRLRTAAITI